MASKRGNHAYILPDVDDQLSEKLWRVKTQGKGLPLTLVNNPIPREWAFMAPLKMADRRVMRCYMWDYDKDNEYGSLAADLDGYVITKPQRLSWVDPDLDGDDKHKKVFEVGRYECDTPNVKCRFAGVDTITADGTAELVFEFFKRETRKNTDPDDFFVGGYHGLLLHSVPAHVGILFTEAQMEKYLDNAAKFGFFTKRVVPDYSNVKLRPIRLIDGREGRRECRAYVSRPDWWEMFVNPSDLAEDISRTGCDGGTISAIINGSRTERRLCYPVSGKRLLAVAMDVFEAIGDYQYADPSLFRPPALSERGRLYYIPMEARREMVAHSPGTEGLMRIAERFSVSSEVAVAADVLGLPCLTAGAGPIALLAYRVYATFGRRSSGDVAGYLGCRKAPDKWEKGPKSETLSHEGGVDVLTADSVFLRKRKKRHKR